MRAERQVGFNECAGVPRDQGSGALIDAEVTLSLAKKSEPLMSSCVWGQRSTTGYFNPDFALRNQQ